MKLYKSTQRLFSLWNYVGKWFVQEQGQSGQNSLSKNIRLYKNKSKLYTNLFISSAYDQNYQIQLVDNVGKVLYTKTTDCNNEAKVIALPTNEFASGKYAVIVSNQTEEVVMPFEK